MDKKLSDEELLIEKNRIQQMFDITDASYFVKQTPIKIVPYDKSKSPIKILFKNGEVKEISCSDKSLLTQFLQQEITKYHYHSI